MTTTNPYVAGPTATSWSAGSSELTDVAGLYQDAVHDHDVLSSVFDTGGFALDVLGDIGDPLGAVISCAVGWIVDHVSFLREPVDWLAGNPESIQTSINTWTNVSTGMRASAQEYAKELSGLGADSWSGAAADAYRAKGAQWVDALDHAGTMAEVEGILIAATGGLCASVRGLIFDAISSAIERWVLIGLVALANSAWTFGASIAGWIVDVEIDAGLLAARMSAKIAELVEKVGRVAETLGRDGSKLESVGQKLVTLAEHMQHNARSARSTLGWDRRYANLDRTGHAAHDGTHLQHSLTKVNSLTHVGAAGTVLDNTKNTVRAASDPSEKNLQDLAHDGTQSGADAATEKAKERIAER